jgi:hypothetical protein
MCTIKKNLNANCTKCPTLQNELHVHEILIIKKIQLNEALKDTYVLSNYGCYNYSDNNFIEACLAGMGYSCRLYKKTIPNYKFIRG